MCFHLSVSLMLESFHFFSLSPLFPEDEDDIEASDVFSSFSLPNVPRFSFSLSPLFPGTMRWNVSRVTLVCLNQPRLLWKLRRPH